MSVGVVAAALGGALWKRLRREWRRLPFEIGMLLALPPMFWLLRLL